MKRLLFILIILFSGSAFAQTDADQSKWDLYLDHGYELTYWDEEELGAWIAEREKEFGQSLSRFADDWHKKIKDPPSVTVPVTSGGNEFSHPEQVYRRLAVAELFLYLSTKEKKRLDESIRAIELLKSKFEKPEIGFWYNFIHAHEAISHNDFGIEKSAKLFAENIFRIWLDVILPLEEAHAILNIPSIPISVRDFSFSLPYLYENLADIILNKAIIQCELSNLGSLGAVIRSLNERLSDQKGYAEKVNVIVNRMSGPKSDNNHLNYTVVFLEAEEHRFDVQTQLNEREPTAAVEEAYKKSLHYYNLAYEWAHTSQGRAAVISDYLDLVSFTYSRLPERNALKDSSFFASLSLHNGNLSIQKAINLFEELASPENRNSAWKKQGFSDFKAYKVSMHSLWNSIVELSLWSAYYHEKGISWKYIEHYYELVNLSQVDLQLYLKFFERNLNDGHMDLIPDNAYFNAAEAAAKLSNLYYKLAPYSSGMTYYYRAFARLLEYVEIFPYNPEAIIELARQLNEMGKPGLYVEYVLPLAERVKKTPSIRAWKNIHGTDPFIESLEKLQKVMPEIMLKANTLIYLQGNGVEIAQEGIKMKLKKFQEESKVFLKGKDIDLESESFHHVKGKLNKLIKSLSAGSAVAEETQRQKLINDVIKLEGEIEELEEAVKIIDRLPEYIDMSRKIRRDLAQKMDHPVHVILNKYFHEVSPEKKNYQQILSEMGG